MPPSSPAENTEPTIPTIPDHHASQRECCQRNARHCKNPHGRLHSERTGADRCHCTRYLDQVAGENGLANISLSPNGVDLEEDNYALISRVGGGHTATRFAGRYSRAMKVKIRIQRESMRVFSVKSRRLALWAVDVALRPRSASA